MVLAPVAVGIKSKPVNNEFFIPRIAITNDIASPGVRLVTVKPGKV